MLPNVDTLEDLSTSQLCEWISNHSDLQPIHKQAAIHAVQTQHIFGREFVELQKSDWTSAGLTIGAAIALNRITNIYNANKARSAISKRSSDWFPENFKEIKRNKPSDDIELESNLFSNSASHESGENCFFKLNDFPPMVNKNPLYDTVFIRQCYVSLFDTLIGLIMECQSAENGNARFNAMITGNPGIGKSYFYLYVIFRFIKRPSMLGDWKLVINSGNVFHMFNDGVFEEVSFEKIRFTKKILRLIDGCTASGQLSGWDGSTVLFASPANSETENKPSRFMKGYESNYFYMPVWDEEELQLANSLLKENLQLSKEEIRLKISLAGPIPRFVLLQANTLQILRKAIRGQLTAHNVLDLLKFVSSKDQVRENHYSHRLLKMVPEADGGYSLNFLSNEISTMVLIETHHSVVAEFKRFALENSDPDSAKFRGNIYEYLFHRMFIKEKFPESIRGYSLAAKRNSFEILLPQKIATLPSYTDVKNIILEVKKPVYGFPCSKTQGAYDAFFWDGKENCYLLQMTIAEEHNILNVAIKKFLDHINSHEFSIIVKFVFVVPSEILEKWSKPQSFVGKRGAALSQGIVKGIDQFVVAHDLAWLEESIFH